MIRRVVEDRVRDLAAQFPVVTLTGPRQSGKTTLCRSVFHQKPYVSLEFPDVRDFANRDPRGFLAAYPDGGIFDEIHHAPELLSYLQPLVDENPAPGRFILTGSANFSLIASIGQSLAGRTGLAELLPLGLEEVRRFSEPPSLFDLMWRGTYPPVYDRGIEPRDWYAAYAATYLERDVRNLLKVGDLAAFQTFMRLAAGRVGQLVNLSALGADAGVTHPTARAWLSVLEAGYVAWRLPPLHANVSKRLVKTPKLHFADTGLVCYLLGITNSGQLREHPLRGTIFETWVASEILKARIHRGLEPRFSFFRDRQGTEVDVVVKTTGTVIAVEAKSGQTIAADYFSAFPSLEQTLGTGQPGRRVTRYVVYGGRELQERTAGTVVPWSDMDRLGRWDSE